MQFGALAEFLLGDSDRDAAAPQVVGEALLGSTRGPPVPMT